MTTHLCIRAFLGAGRYHALEWPPSPARLFQALVAGVMTGGYRRYRAQVRPALAWLERQPPPRIIAAETKELTAVRLAVPNNDFDVVAGKWAKGQAEDAGKIKTMKEVRPRLVQGAPPHLVYCWRMEGSAREAVSEFLPGLVRAAGCLHTLGWGIDMAWAEASVEGSLDGFAGTHWLADPAGSLTLMVPAPGFLADLEESYQRFLTRVGKDSVNPDTRPSAYATANYSAQAGAERPCFFASLVKIGGTADELRNYSRGASEGARVAAWLRHALGTATEEVLPEEIRTAFVFGHGKGEERSDRISYVPLPTIGHPKSDGRIRRVMLLAPPSADHHRFFQAARWLIGAELREQGGALVCRLGELPPTDPVVRCYRSTARCWSTVTPVILHGHNATKGNISIPKTVKLIRQALTEAGYPGQTALVEAFQAAPFWPNTASVHRVMVPSHLQGWPRYHVVVQFSSPVRGPVVAGLGRHYGIGLFAPMDG